MEKNTYLRKKPSCCTNHNVTLTWFSILSLKKTFKIAPKDNTSFHQMKSNSQVYLAAIRYTRVTPEEVKTRKINKASAVQRENRSSEKVRAGGM